MKYVFYVMIIMFAIGLIAGEIRSLPARGDLQSHYNSIMAAHNSRFGEFAYPVIAESEIVMVGKKSNVTASFQDGDVHFGFPRKNGPFIVLDRLIWWVSNIPLAFNLIYTVLSLVLILGFMYSRMRKNQVEEEEIDLCPS